MLYFGRFRSVNDALYQWVGNPPIEHRAITRQTRLRRGHRTGLSVRARRIEALEDRALLSADPFTAGTFDALRVDPDAYDLSSILVRFREPSDQLALTTNQSTVEVERRALPLVPGRAVFGPDFPSRELLTR